MFSGHFVHNIDPVVFEIGGTYFWWYGFSFTAGFLGIFFWLRRNRTSLAMDMSEVYNLTIMMSLGVLLGGRVIEVFFYEWAYYGQHLAHIPALWLGGMSTHGLLFGAILSMVVYCRLKRRSFLELADSLAIAGAYIMGMGRIGNFIDGQIIGSVTDVWWAVKFPDVEGFRHPVVLYDGIKNLMLIPFLLWIRSMHPPRGVVVAHFILWYGFLRIFIDFFREYRTDFLGFPPGQEFNIFMSLLGAFMLVWFYRKRGLERERETGEADAAIAAPEASARLRVQQAVFALLLILPTVIPSDWTQNVPDRYGKRHAGMVHSDFYPDIIVPEGATSLLDTGS